MQYAVWISTAPVCVYSRRFQITIRIRQHDQRACSWREPKDNPVIFLVPPGSSNLGIQVSVFLSSKMGSGWATVVAWRVGEHMSMWSQTLKKMTRAAAQRTVCQQTSYGLEVWDCLICLSLLVIACLGFLQGELEL